MFFPEPTGYWKVFCDLNWSRLDCEAIGPRCVSMFYQLHFPTNGIDRNRHSGSRGGLLKLRCIGLKVEIRKSRVAPVTIDSNRQQQQKSERQVAHIAPT